MTRYPSAWQRRARKVSQSLYPRALPSNARPLWANWVFGISALTPSLLADGDSFYAATVSNGSGAQSLTPSLLTDSDTFYSVTVAAGTVTLSPSLLTDADAFYAATVAAGTVTLSPSLLTDADAFYAATVAAGTVTLSPSLVTDGDSFFAATVSQGQLTILPNLVANSSLFYSAQIGIEQQLLAPLVSNVSTLPSPSVSDGSAHVQYPLAGSAKVYQIVNQTRPLVAQEAYELAGTAPFRPLAGTQTSYPLRSAA